MHRFIAPVIVAFLTSTSLADPPKVIKATPDNGAKDVNPNTKQITIVFDQPMNHGGRSIVGGGETFPELVGQPKWTNDRTIVIDVKLKPDHDYWLSINNQTFTNFRNTKGESAVPYPISFSTAAAAGAAKLSPEVNRKSIEQLRKAIDDNYSYRDLRKLDWDQIFKDATAALEKADTPSSFARQAGEMLAAAKDIHIWLKVGDRTFPSAKRNVPGNLDLRVLPKLVPNWKSAEGGGVAIGKFDDGVTYIMIAAWSNDLAAALDQAYSAIGGADPKKGIIIDVRANSGGDETIAQKFAGCFVSEPKVYSKNTIRHDGKWDGPFDRTVEPNTARPSYRGPVVVLIGKYCMSSNESFILMMKSAGAKLVGEKTYGSSGNPKPVELENGVTVFLPSWKDMKADGTSFEGEGIAPDIEVKAAADDFKTKDPVLEAGIKELKSSAP
ncbi:MAG TPA: S41 family peptidase [Tepidisphaeraceae bacterium]|jgi:hypothetical protein